MATFLTTILCLCAASVAASSAKAFAAVQTADGQSPIKKVIALIGDMKAQTEKEAEEDLAAYDKYMCWCETVKAEKTGATKEAGAHIEALQTFITEAAAKESELKIQIGALAEDITSDKEALASATELRSKESADFATEEADMKETLSLLGEAIGVISEASALQLKKGPIKDVRARAVLLQLRHVVKRFPNFAGAMQKDLFDFLGSAPGFMPKRTSLEQNAMNALPWIKKTDDEKEGMDARPNELKGASQAKSYNSRSGGILGILKAMGDQTAEDLAAAQKTEFEALVQFQSLNTAKKSEIAAATKQKTLKETDLADLLDKVAKSKKDVEKTTGQLTADEQMLLEATKSCKVEEEEYAGRTKVRSEEIKALGETLDILTGDEARELMGKTISLLQFSSFSVRSRSAATNKAMQAIMKVARRNKSWALASLAVRVRLDAFKEVKAKMDKMTAELKQQQIADREKKESCLKKIDETEDLIKIGKNTEEDLDGKHKALVDVLDVLKSEISTLKTEVSEAEVSLKKAGEDRKAANQLYQQSMTDQRATIQILTMALNRLKEFYAPKAAFVAVRVHEQAPPPKPAGYQKSSSGGGVLQLLKNVILDAETTVMELKATEQQSQKEYAAFVSASTKSIEADRSSILEKEKEVASSSSEKSLVEQSQSANKREVDKLDDLLQATHADCDFILKYFDARQDARSEELDGIAEAKLILSGAHF